MTRQILAAMMLLLATAGFAPQQDSFVRNFRPFKGIVPGIDFFAASRDDVTPFENPVKETRAKLSAFLGKELARGALAICSNLEQKDSISERRLLKMGYRWVLILLTPEATRQQMLAQLKAQMGGQPPPALMQLFQNPPPELKAAGVSQLVAISVQRVGNAILMTTLAPDVQFRSSRVDDVGRSPLSDWLDVGLVSYAVGNRKSNLRFLQDRLEEAFPLEDVISMSRPFVAPSEEGSGGGGGAQFGVFVNSGSGGGGTPPPMPASPSRDPGGAGYVIRQSGGPGGGPPAGQPMMTMPKDVQDRMLFDAESTSFFAYLMEKLGIDKCRTLIQAGIEKREIRDLLLRNDMLGSDFDTIEKDWQTWVRNQKAELPANIKMITSPGKPEPKP